MFRVALLFVIFWVEFGLVLQMTTHTVKQDLAETDNVRSEDGWVEKKSLKLKRKKKEK